MGTRKGVGLGLRRERNEIPKPSGKLLRELYFKLVFNIKAKLFSWTKKKITRGQRAFEANQVPLIAY